MRTFLQRWLGFRRGPHVDDEAGPPAWASAMLARLGETPGWVAELQDGQQKAARAQARTALRVEETERKLEAGFSEMRAALDRSNQGRGTDQGVAFEAVFEAMDAMEDAGRVAGLDPAVAQGLTRVVQRLDEFLAAAGFTRHTPRGVAPNGRHFKVVGHEETNLPDGVISRVVRAAVTRDDRVVREGSVLISRRPS